MDIKILKTVKKSDILNNPKYVKQMKKLFKSQTNFSSRLTDSQYVFFILVEINQEFPSPLSLTTIKMAPYK